MHKVIYEKMAEGTGVEPAVGAEFAQFVGVGGCFRSPVGGDYARFGAVFFGGGHQAVAKALAGHLSDVISDQYTHVPMEVLPRLVP